METVDITFKKIYKLKKVEIFYQVCSIFIIDFVYVLSYVRYCCLKIVHYYSKRK